MTTGLNSNSFTRFSIKEVLVLIALSFGYLLLSSMLIGIKPEQFILIILYNGLYFGTPLTRKLILGFSVFAVYWIIFDYMKAFPNYKFNPVHIQELYNIELSLFGFTSNGVLLTANEYWLIHQTAWLDVISGIFYLCWIPVPLLFAGFLFFKDRDQFLRFSFTFLVVNFVGFIIYYTYPAAPPWYYHQFGAEFFPETPGGIAGLGRFDTFFNAQVFKGIYSKSSNVFAAMPSLHSAYPLIVFYFGLKTKLGVVNILLGLVTVGIWFAAVYTSHHYIIDVLIGVSCAAVGIILLNLLLNLSFFKNLFNQYLRRIN